MNKVICILTLILILCKISLAKNEKPFSFHWLPYQVDSIVTNFSETDNFSSKTKTGVRYIIVNNTNHNNEIVFIIYSNKIYNISYYIPNKLDTVFVRNPIEGSSGIFVFIDGQWLRKER